MIDRIFRRPAEPSANARLKKAFRAWFWGGVTAATLAHFAVFLLAPGLTIATSPPPPGPIIDVLEIYEVDLPDRPEPLPQPAPPIPGEVGLEADFPVPEPTWNDEPLRDLRPPDDRSVGEATIFGPWEMAPEVRDPARAREILERHYPERLREAGVGGTVVLVAFIDARGRLVDVQLARSSGHPALDAAALDAFAEIGRKIGFHPGLDLDRPVAVRIEQKIEFSVRR